MRPAVLAALSIAAILAAPDAAPAKSRTYTLLSGPVAMGGFTTAFVKRPVRTPRVDGHITRMHVRLVDGRGRPVTIRDVMLHHVVFRRLWRPERRRECTSPVGEAFYGTGEEDQSLRLPRGYGYRIRRDDRWPMNAMLMSHSTRTLDVYVQYRVTVDRMSRLAPVRAFWVRANGCTPSVSYPIYGGGPPGSVSTMSFEWRVPFTGRIVAAGGHLHGGAKDMWCSQPRCGDRRLLDTRPYYGRPTHRYYRVRPILHEPGPVDTRYFLSRQGIPVIRGETLRLSATYDNQRTHGGVMAVTHVYVATDPRGVANDCGTLSVDQRELRKALPVRSEPPAITIPLTGINSRGRTYTITRPPWPLTVFAGDAVARVTTEFEPPHISLPAGSRLTWRFTDSKPHNVRLANRPALVGTPTLGRGASWYGDFTVPGHYELFCSLHPVTMHQVVEVQPSAP